MFDLIAVVLILKKAIISLNKEKKYFKLTFMQTSIHLGPSIGPALKHLFQHTTKRSVCPDGCLAGSGDGFVV